METGRQADNQERRHACILSGRQHSFQYVSKKCLFVLTSTSASTQSFRFRHAVVGSLLGSKAFRPSSKATKGPRMAEVVDSVTSWNETNKTGKAPDGERIEGVKE